MDMINIMKMFIKAERTGDWQLYLYSLEKMLPFFAASGHNLYLKSVYCHLQQMGTFLHRQVYARTCWHWQYPLCSLQFRHSLSSCHPSCCFHASQVCSITKSVEIPAQYLLLLLMTWYETVIGLYKGIIEDKATTDDVLNDEHLTEISLFIRNEIDSLSK
jgi:hypothetical protein